MLELTCLLACCFNKLWCRSFSARLNIAAIASTTLAAGSLAWYYHLYGPVAFASAPAEEGYVISPPSWTTVLRITSMAMCARCGIKILPRLALV